MPLTVELRMTGVTTSRKHRNLTWTKKNITVQEGEIADVMSHVQHLLGQRTKTVTPQPLLRKVCRETDGSYLVVIDCSKSRVRDYDNLFDQLQAAIHGRTLQPVA